MISKGYSKKTGQNEAKQSKNGQKQTKNANKRDQRADRPLRVWAAPMESGGAAGTQPARLNGASHAAPIAGQCGLRSGVPFGLRVCWEVGFSSLRFIVLKRPMR